MKLALFKPSNFSPNFEEVDVTENALHFSFQVNTNGSTVKAYQLKILSDEDFEEDLDKSILWVKSNNFLSNSFYSGYVSENSTTNNEAIIQCSLMTYNQIKNSLDSGYVTRFFRKSNQENYDIKSISSVPSGSNKYKIIISGNWGNDNPIYYEEYRIDYVEPCEYQNGEIVDLYIDSDTVSDDGVVLNQVLSNNNDYRWSIRIYEDRIDIDEGSDKKFIINKQTYIGKSYLVGSTQNIMWFNNRAFYANAISDTKSLEEKYLNCEFTCTNSNFQPFVEIQNQTISQIEIKSISSSSVTVNSSSIKSYYKDILSSGNVYVQIINLYSNDTIKSPGSFQIIHASTNLANSNYIELNFIKYAPIESLDLSETLSESFVNYVNAHLNRYAITLIYRQRRKIETVDQGVGKKLLDKFTFDDIFDYSLKHSGQTQIYSAYNDFNKGVLYVEPDAKIEVGAYIFLSNVVMDTESGKSYGYPKYFVNNQSSEDVSTGDPYISASYGYKITKYNSKTGEIDIAEDLNFIPNSNYLYRIFKYDENNNTQKWTFLSGTNLENYGEPSSYWNNYYLGGNSYASGNIINNTMYVQMDESNNPLYFYSLFIQPNLAVKTDKYKPIVIKLKNNEYNLSDSLYLSDSELISEFNEENTLDTLDDTQWLAYFQSTTPSISFDSRLIQPKIEYEIYSNFIDSLPESYFYARTAKLFSTQYRNLRNEYSDLNVLDSGITEINVRDIYIKSFEIDENGQNYYDGIAVKNYQYKLNKIVNGEEIEVYSQEKQYDINFIFEYKGLQNLISYNLYFIVEDIYGKIYNISYGLHINYAEIIDETRVQISKSCDLDGIRVDFLPTKLLEAKGQFAYNPSTKEVEIEENGDFQYQYVSQENEELNIPEDFTMLLKIKIDSFLLSKYDNQIIEIGRFSTSNYTYRILLDARYCLINKTDSGDIVFSLNDTYMNIYLEKNGVIKSQKNIHDINNNIYSPLSFSYAIQQGGSTIPSIDTNKVYMLCNKASQISSSLQSDFISTIPANCKSGSYSTENIGIVSEGNWIIPDINYNMNNVEALDNMGYFYCYIQNYNDNSIINLSTLS